MSDPPPPPAQPGAQPQPVLGAALRVLRPLVRLLVRHGVTYPALAAALKRVFLEAAQQELAASGRPVTDSSLTLLSGVHRRDVRTLLRGESADDAPPLPAAVGLPAEVVGHWMADARFSGRTLPRSGAGSFDELVAGISQDVRPRAVLDELLRLGAVRESEAGLVLDDAGFAPRQDFAELSELFAANLHDHIAAAAANLDGQAHHLEQAVFVDELSAESVDRVRQAAIAAWRQAMRTVFSEAQARFEHDASERPAAERRQRARFGVYFFSTDDGAAPAAPAPTRRAGRRRAASRSPSS